jgi:lipopolysaccharide transport system permease protein
MAEAAEEPQSWTKVIEPQRGLFDLGWGELWRYRDLIWQLVVRDFTSTYKQTLLGPFWFVVQPLLMTVAFSFLFGRMAKFTTDGLPHFVFYIGGLAPWTYLADCVSRTAFTFTKNAPVFGKVYFPRLTVPIAGVISSLVGLAVRLAILIAGVLFYLWSDSQALRAAAADPTLLPHLSGVDPNWRIAVVPLLILNMAMLGLGVGCIISALTTRFRDLSAGVGFMVQLWMYASLIIFPLSRIGPENRWIFLLNPMVPVIEGFRFAFLGTGTVEKWHLGVSFAISSILCVVGVVLFNRASRNVMDTV